MGEPQYRLEGIVRSRDMMEDFEGPLDLILHLLSKNKMEIQDISISQILDQYLAWMSARQAMDLEVAGEFIEMASHLMLLKTKMLLKEEDQEAQSEMEELMASLEARERHASYAKIKEVLAGLELRYLENRLSFPKAPEPTFAKRVYRYEHKPDDLTRAVEAWQARQGTALPPDLKEFRKVVRPEPYRVELKARELLDLLEEEGPTSLSLLIARSESRSEVTAVFLALLDLCRGGKVCLAGTMEEPLISVL